MKKLAFLLILIQAQVSYCQTPMFDLNKSLGKGINFGNIFEAPSEGEWGNPFRDDYPAKIKAAGFNHIRMPIRWDVASRCQLSAPYNVNANFLARVKYVVDLAIKENLKIIINMHHHDEIFSNPNGVKARFLTQWRQIASYFKDYPNDMLIFEVMNEPHDNLTPELWNTFFAEALKEIRKSNPTRPVLMGTADYGGVSGITKLVPPNDPNIIVSVHYYNPFNFTHQGAEWVGNSSGWLGTTWNDTELERQAVRDELKALVDFSGNKNIPIHIGEFGSYSTADMASRIRWSTFIPRYIESLGFSWAYWEWSAGFGVFNPSSNSYNTSLLNAILKNPLPSPTNVILKTVYESDFTSNAGGFFLNNINTAKSTLSHANGEINVKIDAISSENWHVQLIKNGIPLYKGKTYKLSFEGKSSSSNSGTFYTSKASDPWNSYSSYNFVQLSQGYKEFSNVFTMSGTTDLNARLVFDIGSKVGNVTIRKIKLEEVILDFSSGLSNLTFKNLSIYPNPTQDKIVIQNVKDPIIYIAVFDVSGKEVLKFKNHQSDTIDVKSLVYGIYTLLASTDKEVYSAKFVKK